MSAARRNVTYQAGATTFLHEHRAFMRQPDRRRILVGASAMTLLLSALWIAILPMIGRVWGHALAILVDGGVPARVVMTVYEPFGWMEVGVPSLALDAAPPSGMLWMATLVVTVLVFAVSFLLPDRMVPLSYAIRAFVLVQASALAVFLVAPESFPYSLPSYLQGMSVTGLAIATASIPVLGLTYFIQDVSWLHKLGLTVVVLAHSVVLVPLQYVAHGLLLHDGSLLFMPVLYLFFGVPLHVFSLVALFAWGMSWTGHLPSLGTPSTDAHMSPHHVEPDDPMDAWAA
ncbi:MAG: hypothetical protein Rubg2KO_13310 [Rubricoccaceae bacterium]